MTIDPASNSVARLVSSFTDYEVQKFVDGEWVTVAKFDGMSNSSAWTQARQWMRMVQSQS